MSIKFYTWLHIQLKSTIPKFKKELNKISYDMFMSRFNADMLFRFGYITAYDKKYIKDITQYKRTCIKKINGKYYLIMIIKPENKNSYIDTEEKEESEALQKFYEWADKIMEGLEDEKN